MDFISRNFDLPENIFYFSNLKLDPLSFVLDWDTEDKFYFHLLIRYFANVLDEPNEHCLVLSKPNNCTYFHNIIPAFDIKYIEECFDLKDFPDPTKFLIKKSCPVTYSKQDIVDCWIHQTKSWSDLIPIQNNDDDGDKSGIDISSIKSCHKKKHYILDSDNNDSEDSNHKELHGSTPTALLKINSNKGNCPDLDPKCSTLRAKTAILINSSSSDNEESSDSIKRPRHFALSSNSTSSNKRSRLPYTHKEDVEIVKFIIKNKYAFNITGRQMWQEMERANISKIRSWQSLKERYIKHIKFDLTSGSYKFPFLTKEELKLLRQGLRIDVIKKQDKEKLKAKFQNERVNDWFSDESS